MAGFGFKQPDWGGLLRAGRKESVLSGSSLFLVAGAALCTLGDASKLFTDLVTLFGSGRSPSAQFQSKSGGHARLLIHVGKRRPESYSQSLETPRHRELAERLLLGFSNLFGSNDLNLTEFHAGLVGDAFLDQVTHVLAEVVAGC